jgi:hypothetical protein
MHGAIGDDGEHVVPCAEGEHVVPCAEGEHVVPCDGEHVAVGDQREEVDHVVVSTNEGLVVDIEVVGISNLLEGEVKYVAGIGKYMDSLELIHLVFRYLHFLKPLKNNTNVFYTFHTTKYKESKSYNLFI